MLTLVSDQLVIRIPLVYLQYMSWLDVIILFPLLIGLIRGLMKGLIGEVFSIAAVILGLVGAKMWSAQFASWLLLQFEWPEAVCIVIAYALLFLGIALALNIVAHLLAKLFQKISLGWLNRLAGGIFGIAKWGLVILVVVFGLHRLDTHFQFINKELKDQSVVYTQCTQIAEKIWNDIQIHLNTESADTTKEDTPANT